MTTTEPLSPRVQALALLAELAAEFPALRLTQIIVTATGVADPFYMSDADLLHHLTRYRETVREFFATQENRT